MIHKFRQSIISMAVKMYISRIGVNDLTAGISDIVKHVRGE